MSPMLSSGRLRGENYDDEVLGYDKNILTPAVGTLSFESLA